MEHPEQAESWIGERLPPVLVEFLGANPHLPERLSHETRPVWFELCRAATRLKSQKARNFFLQIHKIIENIEDDPCRDIILQWALNLGAAKWLLVLPYFSSVRALGPDESFIEKWAHFARTISERDIDLALTFIEKTPEALETYGPDDIFAWGDLALKTVLEERTMWKAARAYLEESAASRSAIPQERWRFFLEQAARIAPGFSDAAAAFIRSGTRCCLLLTDQELESWVTEGLELAGILRPAGYQGVMKRGMGARKAEPDDITSYFSGTSLSSVVKRDKLASGVALKDKVNTLALICEAFLGRPVKIRDNTSLLGVQGFSGGSATDGLTVFLPPNLPDFGLFKLMALHQTALLRDPVWQNGLVEDLNPMLVHLEADRCLLEQLPGLRSEMAIMTPGGLPSYFPHNIPQNVPMPFAWWGDILPRLALETKNTIHKLKLKAEDEVDLPPELLEALLSSMMAEGERNPDTLWGRLKEMFDTVELISPDAEELQENFKTFFYKEWDTGLGDYKLDWTLVRQRFPKADPNNFVDSTRGRLSGLISLIRRQFTRLKPERFRKYRAQPYGDQIDLDALIQAVVEMRSGSYLTDSIYIRRDKRIRDVGVLFLLDLSASTEEKVEGRRIIDIQKEAMVLMAEALDSLGDPYGIFGFSTEGRFRVDMFVVKDFAEEYGENVKNRLGNLEPKGLTRLGAVIRHAAYKLDTLPAAIKLMIVLTDGRPYDLEYGDVNYAIEDTKKAIQEARARKINPFIITSDQKGADYLKRISPQMQSIILPKVELLPTVLPAMYKRLTT